MKQLEEYIYEALLKLPKFTKKEPKENRDAWLKIDCHDKFFINSFDPLYVKLSDIGEHSQKNVLTTIYNLMKDVYGSKCTQGDIMVWDTDGWEQFATAAMNSKSKMWHPEWIDDKFGFR